MAMCGADITLGQLLWHAEEERQNLRLAIAVERRSTMFLLKKLGKDHTLSLGSRLAIRDYVDRLPPLLTEDA